MSRVRNFSLSRLRDRVAAERRARLLAAATVKDQTPPDPSRFASYGRNSFIVPPARVTRPDCIHVGDDVIVLENAFLSVRQRIDSIKPKLTIGDRCRIGTFAHIACVGEVVFGDDVLTAARIFVGDTYHGYEDPDVPIARQPMAPPERVVIGNGAFLGIGSAVLMGVTLGEHAYVAAGAVVTKDVEPRTLVMGNPARPVRRWDPSAGEWVSV